MKIESLLFGNCSFAPLGRGEGFEEVAFFGVPDAELGIAAAGDEEFAVGCDGGGLGVVTGAAEGADVAAVFAQEAKLVVAGSSEGFGAAVEELEGGDFACDAGDGFLLFAGREVPNFDRG